MLFVFMWRCGEGSFETPPLDAHSQGAFGDPYASSPFSQAVRFSTEGDPQRLAIVLGLLERGGPLAVAWFIVAVVIDPFNRVVRRGSWAYVSEEVQERSSPAVAHRNPASAIQVISLVGRVVASLRDSFPAGVFRRLVHSTSSLSAAPTRLRAAIAFAKIPSGHRNNSAAFTKAYPEGITTLCPASERDHREAAVDVANFAYCTWRQLLRIARSHLKLLVSFMCGESRSETPRSGRLVLLLLNLPLTVNAIP
jgi:hypothetical protein